MEKLKELRQAKADLMAKRNGQKAQYDELVTAMVAGNLSDEQKTKLEAIKTETEQVNTRLEELDGFIAQYEVLAQQEREETGWVVAQKDLDGARVKSQPFASFGEQLMAVHQTAKSGSVDARLLEVQAAASGAAAAVDSDGGYLIQTDFANEILQKAYEQGQILSRTNQVGISSPSNRLVMNAVDESSRVNGSRHGGVQVYWEEEAGTPTATKPKFRKIDIKLQKLMGLGYATEELLQDASALNSIMSQAFASEVTFKQEDAIIRGTGAGQSLGLLNSDALVTVSKETGQGADTLVAENIINMYARLYAPSMGSAVWLANQAIMPQLMQLGLNVGTAGQLVYMPPSGLAGAPNGTLLGRPVLYVEQASALGDLGDLMLADLSQYLVINKGGLRADQSMHVKFETDEMAFRFVLRTNGQPMWDQPLTPYKGADTLSPFVALDARA
jgi:HK97 family phage major capsid protein